MQRTMMNVTGGIVLFGLLTLFGVMVWGRSPQVAATLQSPLPTAPAAPIPDAPCLTASDAGFVFDFYGYVHNEDGTTALTYRLNNPNKKDISYVAFGTADWARVEPSDGMTTTLSLGEYNVEWTNDKGNPGFASVKYETEFDGFSQGAMETYTMTVSAFDPTAPIEVEAKAGKERGRVTVTLDDPACDKTPTPPTPTSPFSPLPTPTPTPEGGAVLPTEPVVAECVFGPPGGGMPPDEPVIPLDAYTFSKPTLVMTHTAPIGIEQWLPDSETLMVSRETGISQTVSAVLVNTATGDVTELVKPRNYLREPRWLMEEQTVFWRELGNLSDTISGYWQPGYQLRSFNPPGERRLSSGGNGASISHSSSPNGKEFVFLSLPSGTQPFIWNQEAKEMRALPVDLNDWRYGSSPVYKQRAFNANWQPDGGKILFWDGVWTFLYDLTTDRGCEVPRNGRYYVREASWSPNGRYLLTKIGEHISSIHGPHDLVLILDTYTGESVQYALGNSVYNFSWAPDSQTVAIVKRTDKQIQMADGTLDDQIGITLLNIHTGTQQQILPNYSLSTLKSLIWSPDGARLAFLGFPFVTNGSRGQGGVQISQVIMQP